MTTYIFKSNGNYIGFISDSNIFSRDGVYLGWVENGLVWDSRGNFKGQIFDFNNNHYILKNSFSISPIPRIPRVPPVSSLPPIPPANILPISIPIGYEDSF